MLKILIPTHILPSVTSILTIHVNSLLPELRKRSEVKVYWLVYTPDKIVVERNKTDENIILDFHNYNDALKVLNDIKPDIIFGEPDLGFIEYALSVAGKHLKIPIICGFPPQLFFKHTKKKYYTFLFTRFFKNTVPTDTKESQKRIMRRGNFIIKKYVFLLRTFFAIGMKKYDILKTVVADIVIILRGFSYQGRFAGDLHWLANEKWIDPLVKGGFDKSTLHVTGDPSFDPAFQKLSSVQNLSMKNSKPKILLITAAMYEHGFWTREQRDEVFKTVVSELLNAEEFDLSIKIHPSSESLSEYQELLNGMSNDPKLYQKGDVLEYLKDADVVVTFASTSSILYSVLLKKPVVIVDFLNDPFDNVFLKNGLAQECKQKNDLLPIVRNVLKSNPLTQSKIDEFTSEYLYKFDGKASERVCEMIFSFLKKHHK